MARRGDEAAEDDLVAQVASLRSLLEESSRINTKYSHAYDERDLKTLDRIKQFKTEHPYSEPLGSEGFSRQAEATVYDRLKENLRYLRSAWEKQSSRGGSEAMEGELKALAEAIITELKPLYLTSFVVYKKTEHSIENSPFYKDNTNYDRHAYDRRGVKQNIRDALDRAGEALNNDDSVEYDRLATNVRNEQSARSNAYSPSPDYRLQTSAKQPVEKSDTRQNVQILHDRIADLERSLHEARNQRLGEPDKEQRSWNESRGARRYETQAEVLSCYSV